MLPIKLKQNRLMPMNIRFLEYLSIKVPAYKPKNKTKIVAIPYAVLKKALCECALKYQGMAIILMPCAKPEMALAVYKRGRANLCCKEF